MADVKITALDAHTSPADTDVIPIVDVDPGATKKITVTELRTSMQTGVVTSSREVVTTAPLTGGGDLSANRTLAISEASALAAGSMSAAHYSKLDGIEALADVTDAANVAAAGAVMTTRAVSTTAPLAGGGALSSNLTLTVATATPGAAGVSPPGTPITEATTTRTLADSDHGRTILCTHASGCAVTVPDTVTPGLTVMLVQRGAAQVTITGSGTMVVTPASTFDDSGVARTFGVGSVATVLVESATVANVFGDLEAA